MHIDTAGHKGGVIETVDAIGSDPDLIPGVVSQHRVVRVPLRPGWEGQCDSHQDKVVF